jgi:hypothetical protein
MKNKQHQHLLGKRRNLVLFSFYFLDI